MNNLSDFANLCELQNFFGGRQTEVCAPGAKHPRYTSDSSILQHILQWQYYTALKYQLILIVIL